MLQDCAVLWGVGRQLGLFDAPLPDASPITQLARKHRLSEVSATYAAAAAAGSFLGRLAWGEERLGGIAAAQRRGEVAVPVRNIRGGCMEALEAVLTVASNAAQEHSPVPQPVDVDHMMQVRHEERQSYALASQLASDGHADGLAAKAEMLYFGRSAVLPGSGAGSRAAAVLGLLFAAWLLPSACRRCRRAPAATVAQRTEVEAPRSCGWLRYLLLLLAAAAWLAWPGPGTSDLADLAPDAAEADSLFREAADAGHWGAAYALAMIKLDGENKSEAEPYLTQVVESDADEAARAFAQYFRHRFGLGVAKDPAKAGLWLQQAAAFGEISAVTLLAELNTREDADVTLPGGRNLSVALGYFRQVASAGQLPTRYNIGVLLLQSLTNGSAATIPENLSLADCHEIRGEFAEVARDLDPTVRLLFALAMRPAEVGVTKAHRNAALFWEERIGAWDSASTEAKPTEQTQDAGTCNATEDDVTVELVAAGRFCCNGGHGEDEAFHVTVSAKKPSGVVKCSMDLRGKLVSGEEPSCAFATVYATSYCQLTDRCDRLLEAADASAQTLRLGRRGSEAAACRASSVRSAVWECSPWQADAPARRCAALYRSRAAEHPATLEALAMPEGSAIAQALPDAAVAAAAAGHHLEWLGEFGAAHAWNCAAASMGAPGARLRCAALEAEAWAGHPRNLTKALAHLSSISDHDKMRGADMAVFGTASLLRGRFLLALARSCTWRAWLPPRCDELETVAADWGGTAPTRSAMEASLRVGVLVLAAIMSFLVGSGIIVLRRLSRNCRQQGEASFSFFGAQEDGFVSGVRRYPSARLDFWLLEGCDLGELVDSDEGPCHLLDSVAQVPGSPESCGGEAFMMNGTQYLFMGACSQPEQYESKLYKWDGANLEETQRFSTTDVRGIRYFEIGTTSYLAFTERQRAFSPVYRWNGVEFTEYLTLATSGATALVHFVIDGVPYLAVNKQPASVSVFMWNGSAFEDFQEVRTNSDPRAVAFFEVDGWKCLAVACHTGGGVHVHRWTGSSFVLWQEMEAFYAVDLAAIHVDGALVLAVAEHTQGTRIYAKNNGTDFQLLQRLGVEFTHGCHAFVAGGVQYLALATSSGRRNNVLAWTGNNFERAFCVPDGRTYSWTSFGSEESPYLVLLRNPGTDPSEIFQIPGAA
ncbi:Tspear [Symbiodinium natans]|uniref:Tspear protein n=1 Tax=Symbiodinium natans TaxID=878477 RepID=A0A812G891_9DINO|nr:Tspear [Symbiodinium natans]